MKLNVRWSDIRAGASANSTRCMVALALKRELGASYVSVGYQNASVVIAGQIFKLYLPHKVGRFIRFWDRFHFVLPFSFEIVCDGFLTGDALHFDSTASPGPVCMTRPSLSLGASA